MEVQTAILALYDVIKSLLSSIRFHHENSRHLPSFSETQQQKNLAAVQQFGHSIVALPQPPTVEVQHFEVTNSSECGENR